MTNHDIFKFCPRCAKIAQLEDSRKIVCTSCGFKLYLNIAAAVGGIIRDGEGRILWIRRNRDPQKGLLDLPGGFADFGEDAESALKREIFEELGLEIENVEYFRSIPNIYNYSGVLYHTLDIFFTCNPIHNKMCTNDEVAEVLYLHPKDVSADTLAFDSMKKLLGLLNF